MEIEADDEGEKETHPIPPCEGGRRYMHALNLYHSAHVAFPLHDDGPDLALVVGETDLPRGFCIGFALRGAYQPQSFSHLSVLQQEGIHQVSALL